MGKLDPILDQIRKNRARYQVDEKIKKEKPFVQVDKGNVVQPTDAKTPQSVMDGTDPNYGAPEGFIDYADQKNDSLIKAELKSIQKSKERQQFEEQQKKTLEYFQKPEIADQFDRLNSFNALLNQPGSIIPDVQKNNPEISKIIEQQQNLGMKAPEFDQTYFGKLGNIVNPKNKNVSLDEKSKNKVSNFLLDIGLYDKPIAKNLREVIDPIVNGQDKIEQGYFDIVDKGDFLKGTGRITGGTLQAAMSIIPGVIGLNLTMPVINQTSGAIAEKLGYTKEQGESVAGKLAPFLFGKWIGASSLASWGVDEGVKESGILNNMSEEDQQIARELIGHLAFFGTLIGGKKVSQKFLEPKLDAAFPYTRGMKADISDPKVESILKKYSEDFEQRKSTMKPDEHRAWAVNEFERIIRTEKPAFFRNLKKDIDNIRSKKEQFNQEQTKAPESIEQPPIKPGEDLRTEPIVPEVPIAPKSDLGQKLVSGKMTNPKQLDIPRGQKVFKQQNQNPSGTVIELPGSKIDRKDVKINIADDKLHDIQKRISGEGGTFRGISKGSSSKFDSIFFDIKSDLPGATETTFSIPMNFYRQDPGSVSREAKRIKREYISSLENKNKKDDTGSIKIYRATTGGSYSQPGSIKGIHFTGDPKSAEAYGKNIKEIAITPKKMFVGDPENYVAKKLGVKSPAFGDKKEVFENYKKIVNKNSIKEELLKEGYDSIKIPADTKYMDFDEYIVLDESLLKKPKTITEQKEKPLLSSMIDAARNKGDKISVEEINQLSDLYSKSKDLFTTEQSKEISSFIDNLNSQIKKTNIERNQEQLNKLKNKTGKSIDDLYPGKPTVTDQADVQKIKNSIAEGETILRSGTNNGKKLSKEEHDSIQRSVDKNKIKIGAELKPIPFKSVKIRKVKISTSSTKKQQIVDVKLGDIRISEKDFQGRTEAFSGDSFKRIVLGRIQSALDEGKIGEQKAKKIIDEANDYLKKNNEKAGSIEYDDLTPENTFSWNDFGQILLWKDSKKNLKLLSGHSRTAAADFLQKHFDEFKELPAMIEEGISFDEAQKKALSSNVKATPESIVSHANRLRRLRSQGKGEKDISTIAKSFFNRDAQKVINISYLDPDGYMFKALELAPNDKDLIAVSTWIGNVRSQFPQLTKSHENEIYKYLIDEKMYKTKIKNQTELGDLIERRVNNFQFNPEQPLNLKNTASKGGAVMQQYEIEVADKRSDLDKAKRDLDDARTKFVKAGLKGDKLEEKLKNYSLMVNRLASELAELVSKRNSVLEAESNQGLLFEDAAEYNNTLASRYKNELTPDVDYFEEAEDYFGVTKNPKEAGYLLPNGKMLNFSGVKFHAGTKGSRSLDHTEIKLMFSDETDQPINIKSVAQFVEMGAIRMQYDQEALNIDLGKLPTQQQIDQLYSLIDKTEHVFVDITRIENNQIKTESLDFKYADSYKVIDEIEAALSGKTKRRLFDADLKYSIDQVSTPQFQSWFLDSKIVDANGNPQVMYHGTGVPQNFDEFRKGSSKVGGLIFVSSDPIFSTKFTVNNEEDLINNYPRIYPLYIKAGRPFDHRNIEDRTALIDNFIENGLMIYGVKLHYNRQTEYFIGANLPKGIQINIKEYPGLKYSLKVVKDLVMSGDWYVLEANSGVIKDLGYDAVWITESGTRNLAVYEPTQLKSAIANNGSFGSGEPSILKDDAGVERSLFEIGRKELDISAAPLIVHHNLSPEKLLGARKIGGLVAPSIAISNANFPNNNYGSITLVANKSLIDPKASAKNKVFNADIYSPRYPSVTYKIKWGDKEKIFKRLAELGGVEDKHDSLEIDGTTRIEEQLAQTYLLKTAWLKQAHNIDSPKDPEAMRDFINDYKIESNVNKLLRESNSKVDRMSFAAGIMKEVGTEVDERIFDGFTPMGDRKYLRHTADNVLRIMKRELQGGENFFYGVGSVRAHAAKKFRSLTDITKRRDMVIDGEAMDKVKENLNDLYEEMLDDAVANYKGEYKDPRSEFNYSIVDAIKRRNVVGVLTKDGFGDMDLETVQFFVNTIKEMPTEYFEAKVQRVVQINEFAGAIVPSSTPKAIIEELQKAGITRIEIYDSESKDPEASRQYAFESFSDLLFDEMRDLSSLSKEEKELTRLKDYKRHMEYSLDSLKDKTGYLPAVKGVTGRDRGDDALSKRNSIRMEIAQLDKQISALQKKIPQRVRLDNQFGMFGEETKEEKITAPEQQIDKFQKQLDSLYGEHEALFNEITEAYNEKRSAKSVKDHNYWNKVAQAKSERLVDIENNIEDLKKQRDSIDSGKPTNPEELKADLLKKKEDLENDVDSFKVQLDRLEKINPGLFNSEEHYAELDKIRADHKIAVKKLAEFLDKNTNIFNGTGTGLFELREQIRFDFELNQKSFDNAKDKKVTEGGVVYRSLFKNYAIVDKASREHLIGAERRYKLFKQLRFFGDKSAVITSSDDVAFLMDQLNDESVEHAFVVHVLESGKPVIQHLSSGTFNSTIFESNQFMDLAKRLKTKEIHFVHNHPSGQLTASTADWNVFRKLEEMFADSNVVIRDGIIIDIRRGIYAAFNRGNIGISGEYKIIGDPDQLTEHKALTFGKTKFFDPIELGDFKMYNTADIATYLSKTRFGYGNKNVALIVSSSNQVQARVVLNDSYVPYGFDPNNLARELSALTTQFNGTGIILVNNTNLYMIFGGNNAPSLKTRLNESGVRLVDVLSVKQRASELSQFTMLNMTSHLYDEISSNTGLSFLRDDGIHNQFNPLPGNKIQDSMNPRLDKYIDKVMRDMPPKLDAIKEERLKELSLYKELSAEEKKEMKSLKAEKQKMLDEDPFEVHRLSTLIKMKIRNLRSGYKVGAGERQKQLTDLKSDVATYGRKFLPRGDYRKSEITPLLTQLAKVDDLDGAAKIFTRIRDLERKITKRKLIGGINKMIRNADRTKGDPDFVVAIKNIRRMKQADVELEIAKIYERASQRDLSDEEDQFLYLLQRFSDIKNKTVDELTDLYQELKEAIEQGRNRRKEWLAAEKERLNKIRVQTINTITGGKGTLPDDVARAEGLDKETISPMQRLSDLDTVQHSWEWIMDKLSKLDKGSEPLHSFLNNYFADQIFQARNAEDSGTRKYLDLLRNKMVLIYGAKGRNLVKELNKNSGRENTGAFRTRILEMDEARIPTRTEQVELILSQNEAAKILLEWEDPTLAKTFENMGISEQTISALKRYVRPAVWEWARWQKDIFYPEYYKGVNEVYKKLRGVELAFNKHYTPISRDVAATVTDSEMLGDNTTEHVSIFNGHLQPRIANTRPLRIQDLDRVLMEHIIEMEHFKAFAPIMKDLRAVFNDPNVQKAIKQYHSPTMVKVINRFLNDFARGGVDRRLVVGALDKLRGNFAKSVIGVNPVVLLKQMTSFPAFLMEVPIKDFTIGLADFIKNPVSKIRFLMKHSEHMKSRYKKGWERDIILAMQRARKTTSRELGGGLTFTDIIMYLPKLGDQVAVLSGGWTVYRYRYNKAIKEGKTEAAAIKTAIDEFEKSTKRSQQAGDVEDLGELQRQGSWAKLWTLFATSPKQYYSNSSSALRNLIYKRGKKSENLKRFFIAHFLLPTLFQYISNGFSWQSKDQIRALALGSFNGILIIGDILESLMMAATGEMYYAMDSTPMTAVASEIAEALVKLNKWVESFDHPADEFFEVVDDLASATSKPLGVPYDPARKVVTGIKDFVAEPESTDPLRMIGFSKHIMEKNEDAALPDDVKLIKEREARLNKMKDEARKTMKAEDIEAAKRYQKDLEQLKHNSKNYQDQKKNERKDNNNDPFKKKKNPGSQLGNDLLKKMPGTNLKLK